jgi:hypothetical protein
LILYIFFCWRHYIFWLTISGSGTRQARSTIDKILQLPTNYSAAAASLSFDLSIYQ